MFRKRTKIRCFVSCKQKRRLINGETRPTCCQVSVCVNDRKNGSFNLVSQGIIRDYRCEHRLARISSANINFMDFNYCNDVSLSNRLRHTFMCDIQILHETILYTGVETRGSNCYDETIKDSGE